MIHGLDTEGPNFRFLNTTSDLNNLIFIFCLERTRHESGFQMNKVLESELTNSYNLLNKIAEELFSMH